MSGYWIEPSIIIYEVNIGRISKIVNFHPIDLGFERVAYLVIEFNHQLFKVNMDQNVNIGLRSTTKVVFLKSSIYICGGKISIDVF